MTHRIEDRVLHALFRLSRATLPIDVAGLAGAAGLSTVAAGVALVRLERAGYADASRARLTMAGLVRAASLEAIKAGLRSGRACEIPRGAASVPTSRRHGAAARTPGRGIARVSSDSAR